MIKYCYDICGKEMGEEEKKFIDIPIADPVTHDISFDRHIEVCKECHNRLNKDREKRWNEFQYKEALIMQGEIRRIRGEID